MINLNRLKQMNKIDTVDYIYKEISDLLLEKNNTIENKYKEIDSLIIKTIDDNYNFNVHFAFLNATYRFKHKLKNRIQLWNKTVEEADQLNLLVDNQVKNILNNLE